MSASQRDDFQEGIKRVLGQRVNYLCSNPNCRDFTSGPHSDDNKPLILGIAAHICAASPGGPRYDPQQTPDERSSATNGIWLCNRHAMEIDKDAARFPASLLRRWKADTEAFVAGGSSSPGLPQISLKTLDGLQLIEGRTITEQNARCFRDHELVVENKSSLDLRDVEIIIQFPEKILQQTVVNKSPIGSEIRVQAPQIRAESVPASGPGGPGSHWNLSSGKSGAVRAFEVMRVTATRLPALAQMSLTLMSIPSTGTFQEAYENNSGKIYRYKVQGTFAFTWHNEVRHMKTWVHLHFDLERRKVVSQSTLASHPPGNHVDVTGGFMG